MREALKEYAIANHVPIVREESAEFLRRFCEKNKPNRILEIGTAIGYSGLIMLEACEASLVTIEINEERLNIAKDTLRGKKVEFILGDAYEEIQRLDGKFDLIFLDGPKSQYIKYLPHLLRLLDKNGYILADNILFNGLVESDEYPTHKHRTHILNMRKFLKTIKDDTRLNVELHKFADGMAVISWK